MRRSGAFRPKGARSAAGSAAMLAPRRSCRSSTKREMAVSLGFLPSPPSTVQALSPARASAAVLALDHDPAHSRLLEGEHRLVAEVVRLLAERARRPVAQSVDRRLAGALGVHQLLRALRAFAAEEQRLRLGAVLAGGDRHRQAGLVEAVFT